MPAVLVVRRVQRTSQLADHLNSQDIGGQGVATGRLRDSRRRQNGRDQGCTGMGIGRMGDVVIIDRMRQGAVVERAVVGRRHSVRGGERCGGESRSITSVCDDTAQHPSNRFARPRNHAT